MRGRTKSGKRACCNPSCIERDCEATVSVGTSALPMCEDCAAKSVRTADRLGFAVRTEPLR